MFSHCSSNYYTARCSTFYMLAGLSYWRIQIFWNTHGNRDFFTNCAQPTPVATHNSPQYWTVHSTQQRQMVHYKILFWVFPKTFQSGCVYVACGSSGWRLAKMFLFYTFASHTWQQSPNVKGYVACAIAQQVLFFDDEVMTIPQLVWLDN